MYLLTNERYITYQRGFSLRRLGHAQGWDFGVLWGVGGQKIFFPKIQPDLVCELLTLMAHALAQFLAHLSRRLMGELIVYQSLRRPSVRRPSVSQHFHSSSPLKPLGQLNPNFIFILLRTRERKFAQMVLVT